MCCERKGINKKEKKTSKIEIYEFKNEKTNKSKINLCMTLHRDGTPNHYRPSTNVPIGNKVTPL
jgi:hypothetical protein